MAFYEVVAHVFDDVNSDGSQDAGEAGLSGRLVEVLQGNTVIVSGSTDVNGVATLDLDAHGAGTYTVRCTPPPGWIATTAESVSVTLSSLVPTVDVFFGQVLDPGSNRECFQRPSRWVRRVCWVPGRGVQVQFKDRHGRPYFECYYPGTTHADYLALRRGGSLGRQIHARYYHRPYVPVPLQS